MNDGGRVTAAPVVNWLSCGAAQPQPVEVPQSRHV